ncbi:3-keto-5-aminohexanoate cleavage protein [Mesorhizobium sp. M0296]|uniref:3-keto-5-aminohexanoate cleavage protein n=1 Tax=Mesorhizobium sp. M0296 TaxID=2956931 RepID=UPI0033361FC0
MTRPVIITCAVTGGGETVSKSPHVPVSPEQIAEAAVEAARRGAAVVHCHVRDPNTGAPSRDPALFSEVTRLIRLKECSAIINLTTGIGADLVLGRDADLQARSDLTSAQERTAHLQDCLPEACSLDVGTMNFGSDDNVFVNIPDHVRSIAKFARALHIKPEMEVFELGHLRFAMRMVEEGLLEPPPHFQICLGIPWGAPADSDALIGFVRRLPPGAVWSAFGIGAAQFPMAAQAVILGGHVRVGLEDNLYLEKGVLATNGQLVDRAVQIVKALNHTVATPFQARQILGLKEAKL